MINIHCLLWCYHIHLLNTSACILRLPQQQPTKQTKSSYHEFIIVTVLLLWWIPITSGRARGWRWRYDYSVQNQQHQHLPKDHLFSSPCPSIPPWLSEEPNPFQTATQAGPLEMYYSIPSCHRDTPTNGNPVRRSARRGSPPLMSEHLRQPPSHPPPLPTGCNAKSIYLKRLRCHSRLPGRNSSPGIHFVQTLLFLSPFNGRPPPSK